MIKTFKYRLKDRRAKKILLEHAKSVNAATNILSAALSAQRLVEGSRRAA